MIGIIIGIVAGVVMVKAGLGILVTGANMISLAVDKVIKMFKK